MRKGSITILFVFVLLLTSCSIKYSFSGTSIKPDVKTYSVEYFENKALKVNPSLSNTVTEGLIDKYRKLTSLSLKEENGDLIVSGNIIGYDTKPMAVTAEELSAQTRLTITIKVMFSNRLHPEEDFERTFSSYADFDSTQSLESVESSLCDEIVEKIIEDIFNATVANW